MTTTTKQKRSWTDKYRSNRFEPVTIHLSTGTTLRIYVGNGFDGGSGFNFDGPRHGEPPIIAAKDYRLVRRALLWYVTEEMGLRQREGTISTKFFDWLSGRPLKQAPPTYQAESSPYQAVYMAGQLTPTKPTCSHEYEVGRPSWGQLPERPKIDLCSLCLITRPHKRGTKSRATHCYPTLKSELKHRGII